jgi:hypothetical protein
MVMPTAAGLTQTALSSILARSAEMGRLWPGAGVVGGQDHRPDPGELPVACDWLRSVDSTDPDTHSQPVALNTAPFRRFFGDEFGVVRLMPPAVVALRMVTDGQPLRMR